MKLTTRILLLCSIVVFSLLTVFISQESDARTCPRPCWKNHVYKDGTITQNGTVVATPHSVATKATPKTEKTASHNGKKEDDDKKTSKDTSKEKQASKKPSKTAKNQGNNDDDKYTQSGFNENSTDRDKLGPYEESPYTVRSIQTEHAPVVSLKNPFLWIEHKNNGETSVTCAFNDCMVECTQLINNGTYVIVHYNGDMIVITIIKDVDTYKVVSTNPYTLLVTKDGYKAKVY